VVELGYALSSEEFGPQELVDNAVRAGENLNEHILGDRWPTHQERLGLPAVAGDS
jgi:hypothetical protein